MRISKSFLAMFIVWLLGFTHFLGGPYSFFRFIFWVALLPVIISGFLIMLLFFKTKKNLRKNTDQDQKQETLHVDAVIKE